MLMLSLLVFPVAGFDLGWLLWIIIVAGGLYLIHKLKI